MTEPTTQQFVRRAFVKKILRRILALATLVGLIYGLTAVVYATKTIFKVKMNYAVVLERFGGHRPTARLTVVLGKLIEDPARAAGLQPSEQIARLCQQLGAADRVLFRLLEDRLHVALPGRDASHLRQTLGRQRQQRTACLAPGREQDAREQVVPPRRLGRPAD